jgi:4-amino-4-deoxy-L-arabinose transferase-like glycosyltransferase
LAPDGSGYTIEFQSSIRAMKQGLNVSEFPTTESARIGPGGSPSFATGVAFVACLLREACMSVAHFWRDHRVLISVVTVVYILASFYLAFVDSSVFIDHGYPVHGGGDSYHYALLTENLVAGHGFSVSESAPYVPDMLRSPGYSAFLVPLYVIDHTFRLAIVVQIFLVIGTALLIQAIGRKILPDRWASAVAFAYALDPTTIFYSLSIWSDTLFVFLLSAGFWLMFARTPRGWASALVPGVIMALAAYVRPAGGYLIWILAAFFVVAGISRIGWKKTLVSIIALLVAYGAVLAPWYVRNYKESGVAVLSSIGPYTLLLYDVHDFLISRGQSPESVNAEIASKLPFEGDALRNAKYSYMMTDIAKEYIKRDPIGYATFHMFGSVNLLVSSSIRDLATNLSLLHTRLEALHLMSDNSVNVKSLIVRDPVGAVRYSLLDEPLLTLERVFRLATVFLAAVAFVLAIIRKRTRFFVLLFAIIVAYTALVIGPVSYPRYRMSAEPFLFMMAAAGAVALLPRRAIQ